MKTISVGMIVFNGLSALPEGMLKASIYQMYDIAEKIVIVEGATKADRVHHYFDGDTSDFTKDGTSTDGTRSFLNSLSDPQHKIKVIMKNSGFWNGKTEMCNQYLSEISSDYVWHIDADEFYHEKDIPKIISFLDENPFAINFYAYHFYGGYGTYIGKEFGQNWGNNVPWRRIYRNLSGKSRWISHEPPNFLYDEGIVCDEQPNVISRERMDIESIRLYHYSQVEKKQAEFKRHFYQNPRYIETWEKWHNNQNENVFDSKTKPFLAEHPNVIKRLLHMS